MKKLFYFLSLTAALAFAASCAKEADIDPVKGDLVETTFTVTLDDATATKAAIGNNAANIDKLVVRAFKKSDESSLNTLDENFTIGAVENNNSGQKQFSVQAKLVRNFEYTIGFFAYHDGAPYELGDDGVITMTPVAATKANDETLDAFYAVADVTLNPEDPTTMSKSITLTRPLAQVNILSDPADWAAATTSGITADALQSSVSIANAPNKLNLLNGAVSGDVTLAYAVNAIPEGTINVAAANATAKDAKYIAMAYVLSDDTGKNFNVTFNVPAIAEVGFAGFTRTVNNMPAKRNYRTNLHGDLFTVSGDFTVTIDPTWGGNDDNQDINIPQPTVNPAPSIPDGISSANPGIVQPTISTGNNININTASPALYFGIDSNSDGAISYASSNTSVGTISDAGVFTVVGAGDTDVTIHQMAGDQTKAVGDPLSDITIVYHVHVEAVAPTTYAITKADVTNGTLTVKIGDDEVTEAAADAIISVIATPADGYQIATLTYTPAEETAVDIKAAGSFTMPAKAVNVAATFELIPATNYTITVNQPAAGGTIAASAESAPEGTEITLTPSPATGYELGSWTVMNGSDAVTVTANKFDMPAGNVTVTATFNKINYTISVGTLSGGSLSATSTANYGDEVTVTVSPADGKQLTAGSLKYTPEGGTATAIDETTKKFTMPAANVTLSAAFEDIPVTTYSVNIDDLTNGSITASPSTAAEGETVTLTITPSNHYQLKAGTLSVINETLTVEVSLTGYTFVMPASDVLVDADFELKPYSITVNPASNGTVVSDFASAVMGATVTLTITPDSGYELSSLSVTGVTYPGDFVIVDNQYAFEMPGENVTVNATFAESTPTPSGYSINVTQPTGGTISLKNGNDAIALTENEASGIAENTVVTLVATPSSGYVFGSWVVKDENNDDVPVSNNTFTMPAGNVTVTAVFNEAKYRKVTTITSGKKYLLVAATSNKALSGISTSSTKYGLGENVTITNNTISVTSANTAYQVTITSVGNSQYTMSFGGQYLTWTSGNSLNVASSVSDNTKWTVEITNGVCVFSNVSTVERQIWWNSSSPRFACYTGKSLSDTGYEGIVLYELDE